MIVAAVSVGLLGSIWKYHGSENTHLTTQEELWIGWLTWALLYTVCLCFSCTRQPAAQFSNATKPTSEGLWSRRLTIAMLSAAIVVVHFARNRGTIPSASVSKLVFSRYATEPSALQPIVTLATFLTTIAIPSNQDRLHLLENGQTSKDQDSQEPCLLDRSITPLQIPFRVPVNLLLVLLLVVSSSPSNRPFLVTAATSVLFVAAQTVVFILIPRLSCRSYSASPTLYTLIDWDLVEKLSLLSTACFTCLLIYSISISSFSAPNLLSISRAVAESASWISVFVLVKQRVLSILRLSKILLVH